jgi:glucose/arabinose dehydrogenase
MKVMTIHFLFLFFIIIGPKITAYGQMSPPAATKKVKISVPQDMQSSPFNTERYATVPEDFSISVYARIPVARFMAVAPNGDLLVSQPDKGKVNIVRHNGILSPVISDFVSGLQKPHDIVFHTIQQKTYVYISEKNRINRYEYNTGDLTGKNREIVVDGLPDESLPELKGNYGHYLKNIALDQNHKLYVSIASTCNACISDTESDPVRGAIYQYDADGKNRKLFARGLRNAEGLAFVPGTNDLWVVVNNRDNILDPSTGANDLSFIDNNPPEEFTRVVDGGNYGWPFCNPSLSEGLDNMPFDNDYEFNQNGNVDCGGMNRINKGIQAHSAPLGFIFTQNTAIAMPYRNGAIIALHGAPGTGKKNRI